MAQRGKSVELPNHNFTTQKEAELFFREMLSRNKTKDRLSQEDAFDLENLLKRHPCYKEKVGCGVGHFKVMKADKGTDCFYIVRTDGKQEHFSYLTCIQMRLRAH